MAKIKTLSDLRNEKGYTQQQLAEIIGKSQETISQYESGTRVPSVIVAKKIALVLGVSLDSIFFIRNISKGNITKRN